MLHLSNQQQHGSQLKLYFSLGENFFYFFYNNIIRKGLMCSTY